MSHQLKGRAEVHDDLHSNTSDATIAAGGDEVAKPVEIAENAEADLPVSPSEKVNGIDPPPNGGLVAWLQVSAQRYVRDVN